MANPDFEPDVIKKVSKAAYGLCCWVRAMEAYDRVAKARARPPTLMCARINSHPCCVHCCCVPARGSAGGDWEARGAFSLGRVGGACGSRCGS